MHNDHGNKWDKHTKKSVCGAAHQYLRVVSKEVSGSNDKIWEALCRVLGGVYGRGRERNA